MFENMIKTLSLLRMLQNIDNVLSFFSFIACLFINFSVIENRFSPLTQYTYTLITISPHSTSNSSPTLPYT